MRDNGHRVAALYRRHGAEVLRYCRRLGADPHTAEDLAQEAFLRAQEAERGMGDRLPGDEKALAWLRSVAKRYWLNGLRADRAHHNVVSDETNRLETETPIMRPGLTEVLATLPERERRVIELRHLEGSGQSFRDIAEELCCSEITVRRLHDHARSAVRSCVVGLPGG